MCIKGSVFFTILIVECSYMNLGIAIRTTLENSLTVHYCGLIQALVNKSSSVVKDLDPANDLTFLRIRSKKSEIMVAPRMSTRIWTYFRLCARFISLTFFSERDLLLIVIQKA